MQREKLGGGGGGGGGGLFACTIDSTHIIILAGTDMHMQLNVIMHVVIFGIYDSFLGFLHADANIINSTIILSDAVHIS